jgi:peptidoglycan/LPS O-acetylase OafA/YrhL
VLLLQNVFGTGRINYVFWSIALEWQIYFLFPLLVVLFRRWGMARTVGLAMVVGYSLTLSGIPRINHANFHYLGLFALGMVAARIAFDDDERLVRLKERGPWRPLAAVTILPATGLILFWGWRTAIDRWPLLDLIVGVGAASLLLAAAQAPRGGVSRGFSWSPLASIGRFSYSLYLIHAPILQLMWLYALKPLGLSNTAIFIALVVGGLPIILGVSYLYFKAFEAPFMNTSAPARVLGRAPA